MPLAPILIGAGVGATLMCLLDPSLGRRRRALLQQKSKHLASVTRAGADKAARDVRNRLAGVRHRTRSLIGHREEILPDHLLADRVRSQLGRFVQYPRAIDVEVADGVVTLSGTAVAGDLQRIVRRVGRISCVRGVEDRLESRAPNEHLSHESPPARLRRGATTLASRERGPGDRSWNPSTRAAGTLAGAAALSWAAARRTPIAMAAGTAGAALLARSLTNHSAATWVGVGDRAGGVRVRKSLWVDAPVEQVFGLWSHPQVFPRFLTHLDSVEPLGAGRYRWVAKGPGGVPVAWEAEFTEIEPNRCLGWCSVEGSTVDTEGFVRFTPEKGGTRVEVDMTYVPPGGLLGQSVAWLTGRDARSALNQDLVRFKSLLEDGKTTAQGEEITLDEILATA